VVGNGPPGTFVVFPELRVSLPTDQIVFADDRGGFVVVGFGGMVFRGVEGDRLVFDRVREVHPEEQLSPARSRRMVLQRSWIRVVKEGDRVVWPAQA
jgi:hypothetical protein